MAEQNCAVVEGLLPSLVQQRSENRENSHQCGQAADDDEPVESYDAFDICSESRKLFSHLCQKFFGLIGDFGVELVKFLNHIFHCVAFCSHFKAQQKLKTTTDHNNRGKSTPMFGEKNWWQEWVGNRAFLPREKLTHSGSGFEMVIKDSHSL
jgi:hypothetical protein